MENQENPTKRKLATIQIVKEIKPIPNADAIVCTTILGWHCVVKKDEFKEGQLCVYFEVDSLLPAIPEFEFLAKGNSIRKSFIDGKEYEGYRLKTIKLRGQISQGLCLPLSILNGKRYPTDTREHAEYEFKEGDDVSSLLGIVKYEPAIPANLAGKIKGMFPSFIPKTDEMRIQGVPQILERYKDMTFYVTEKLDGASCTIFLKDGELNVCSRNLNLLETPENTFWKVARELKLQEKLTELGRPIALQGELIGSNVQSNRLNQQGHKIWFYNAYDYELGKYLDFKELLIIALKLGITLVPIEEDQYKLPKTIDEIVKFATRKSRLAQDLWAEGIVVRPHIETHDVDLGRLTFKVINPEYLLKHGE